MGATHSDPANVVRHTDPANDVRPDGTADEHLDELFERMTVLEARLDLAGVPRLSWRGDASLGPVRLGEEWAKANDRRPGA